MPFAVHFTVKCCLDILSGYKFLLCQFKSKMKSLTAKIKAALLGIQKRCNFFKLFKEATLSIVVECNII